MCLKHSFIRLKVALQRKISSKNSVLHTQKNDAALMHVSSLTCSQENSSELSYYV